MIRQRLREARWFYEHELDEFNAEPPPDYEAERDFD